jgi:hypothetical protein
MSMGQNEGEPTIGQLVANASKDLSSLVRSELQLAQAELKASASAAGKGAGLFSGAAFLGLLAVILLSIAAAYGIRELGLHPAVAFVIVAAVYLLVAAVLALVGRSQLAKAKPPNRAIETSKQSVEALKAIGKGD